MHSGDPHGPQNVLRREALEALADSALDNQLGNREAQVGIASLRVESDRSRTLSTSPINAEQVGDDSLTLRSMPRGRPLA
jgi:hypothetical protein